MTTTLTMIAARVEVGANAAVALAAMEHRKLEGRPRTLGLYSRIGFSPGGGGEAQVLPEWRVTMKPAPRDALKGCRRKAHVKFVAEKRRAAARSASTEPPKQGHARAVTKARAGCLSTAAGAADCNGVKVGAPAFFGGGASSPTGSMGARYTRD